MVFNFHGNPPEDLSLLPEHDRPAPLGAAKEVREVIALVLPGVDWSDTTWGVYEGEGFSFEFNAGPNDPIDSIMIHVRGGGDAIAALLAFAIPNKWSLLDCSTCEFIDPMNPSQEGWQGFQNYRDHVIKPQKDKDSE